MDYKNENFNIVTGGFQKQVVSAFNIPIIVDTLIDNINVDDYDAMAIPLQPYVSGLYRLGKAESTQRNKIQTPLCAFYLLNMF